MVTILGLYERYVGNFTLEFSEKPLNSAGNFTLEFKRDEKQHRIFHAN